MYLAIQLNDLCTGGQDWLAGYDTVLWVIQMMFQLLILSPTDSLFMRAISDADEMN